MHILTDQGQKAIALFILCIYRLTHLICFLLFYNKCNEKSMTEGYQNNCKNSPEGVNLHN